MSKSLSFNPLWLMLLAGMAWLWAGATAPHLQPTSVTSNSWVNLGPEGGKVNAIVFDPTDANVVYAGTYGGGVFKSLDAGQTWIVANTGLTNASSTWVNTLAIHPFTPTTLYLGTYFGGAYQSQDGGAQWDDMHISNDFLKSNVTHFAINPSDPTVLYASTFSGMMKSVSGGSQWSSSGLSGYLPDVVIHPLTPTIVFAIDQGKVYQTINSGTSWQVLTQVVSSPYVTAFDLEIDPLTPSTLYLGTSQGVFKSVDTGATWQTTALTNTLVQVVQAHPLTPTLVYAGTSTGVWVSANGGANWNAIGARDLNVQVLEIQPTRPDILWLGTNGQGVIKLQDGLASPVNNGLYGVQVEDLAIDPVISSTYYVGAGYGAGVFQSLDHGQTWSRVSDGLPNDDMVWAVAVDSLTPTTLYAGTNDGLFRSLNGGQSWLTTTIGPGVGVDDITIHPITPSMIYLTTDKGLSLTTDSGYSWQTIYTFSIGSYFDALYIHPLSPTVLYGTSAGGSGLKLSTNGGLSWTSINAGLPANFENHGLVLDPLNPLTVFVATSTYYTFTGVFKSVNGGASWEAFNTGLAAYPARGLALSPDVTTLYLLTSGEAYSTSLLSPEWQSVGVGGADYYARSLTVAPYPPGRLLAVTEGGLFSTAFSGIPTVTPTSSPTASPSPTVTPTPSPSATATPTPTNTPTNTTTPTASPTPLGINLAAGITATSDVTLNWPGALTDGDKWANSSSGSSGQFAYTAFGAHYAQLDLGAVYVVNTLKVWHYAADGRAFTTTLQVSLDGVTWDTIFNSAVSGRYSETAAGRTYNITPRLVRYVRDTLNGSTVSPGNWWVELEVWGVLPTVTPTATATATRTATTTATPTVTSTPTASPTPLGINLAAGITATSDVTLNWPGALTDGDQWANSSSGSSGQFAYTAFGAHYAQLDLGAVYVVNTLKVWHYAADGRAFTTTLQVSVDGVTWDTIFNSAVSGRYSETAAGRTYNITPRLVRYVRDTLNGSTVSPGNWWVELEVWGVLPTATPTATPTPTNTPTNTTTPTASPTPLGVNLAAGITATSDVTLNWPGALTDGDQWANSSSGSSGQFAYTAFGAHYAQLDLGAVYVVNTLKVWHYAADGRAFTTTLQVSLDGITWDTIFNSTVSGRYSETAAGRTYNIAPRLVRYVRDTLNGSTVSPGNWWVELEVWGVLPTVTSTATATATRTATPTSTSTTPNPIAEFSKVPAQPHQLYLPVINR